jgi:hypothetical protein
VPSCPSTKTFVLISFSLATDAGYGGAYNAPDRHFKTVWRRVLKDRRKITLRYGNDSAMTFLSGRCHPLTAD